MFLDTIERSQFALSDFEIPDLFSWHLVMLERFDWFTILFVKSRMDATSKSWSAHSELRCDVSHNRNHVEGKLETTFFLFLFQPSFEVEVNKSLIHQRNKAIDMLVELYSLFIVPSYSFDGEGTCSRTGRYFDI